MSKMSCVQSGEQVLAKNTSVACRLAILAAILCTPLICLNGVLRFTER